MINKVNRFNKKLKRLLEEDKTTKSLNLNLSQTNLIVKHYSEWVASVILDESSCILGDSIQITLNYDVLKAKPVNKFSYRGLQLKNKEFVFYPNSDFAIALVELIDLDNIPSYDQRLSIAKIIDMCIFYSLSCNVSFAINGIGNFKALENEAILFEPSDKFKAQLNIIS